MMGVKALQRALDEAQRQLESYHATLEAAKRTNEEIHQSAMRIGEKTKRLGARLIACHQLLLQLGVPADRIPGTDQYERARAQMEGSDAPRLILPHSASKAVSNKDTVG